MAVVRDASWRFRCRRNVAFRVGVFGSGRETSRLTDEECLRAYLWHYDRFSTLRSKHTELLHLTGQDPGFLR
jgi:hypothetical protein